MNAIRTWLVPIKNYRPSLRTAIAVPFVVVITCTVAVLAISQYREIKNLVHDESMYLLNATTQATTDQLHTFLDAPFLVQKNAAQEIGVRELYSPGNLEGIHQHLLRTLKNYHPHLAQISTLAFGSELAEFTAVRREPDQQNFSLLLKDKSTAHQLLVFPSESPQASPKASYAQYDPRTRPWYTRAAHDGESSWAPIDVSDDEHREIHISPSTLVKINKQVVGVLSCDIRLDALSDFLKQQPLRRNGVIFITEMNGRLIAQSESSPILAEKKANDQDSERLFMSQSGSPIIKAASHWVKNTGLHESQNFTLSLEKEMYFGRVTPFNDGHGLQWRVVTLIPESDLLGNVLSSTRGTLLGMLLMALIGIGLGLWAIDRMTLSIRRTAQAAGRIAQGDMDVRIQHQSQIQETHTLITVFNQMSNALQNTLHQLQEQVYVDDINYLHTRQDLIDITAEAPSSRAVLCVVALNIAQYSPQPGNSIYTERVLQAVARRLREKLPKHAIAARLDTEVLAILFNELNPDEAPQDYAVLTQTLFATPFTLSPSDLSLKVQIGFTSGLLKENDLPDWIHSASQALRKAIKNQSITPQKFEP